MIRGDRIRRADCTTLGVTSRGSRLTDICQNRDE
jgi:hypothetical protein